MNAFFVRFRQLHAMVRTGKLPPALREEYNFCCASLTQMMLAAQQMAPNPGTLRGALRMATVLKAEIEPAGGKRETTATIDLGQSGFAALLGRALTVGGQVQFVVHLPLGPINGQARVVSSRVQSGAYRTGFAFENMAQPVRDALQVAIIDSVLSRIEQQTPSRAR